jgi:hypothetical protein
VDFNSLLKDPKIKAAFFVIAAVLVLYLATGSWLSKINFTDKSIHNYWGMLIQSTDRRMEMIPKFAQLFQTFDPQAQDVQQALGKAYHDNENLKPSDQVFTNSQEHKAFSDRQTEIVMALLKAEVHAQQVETLAQNRQYLMIKMELLNLEKQIQSEEYFINREVKNYNDYLTGFPEKWINQLFFHKQLKMTIEIPTVKDTLGQ